MCGVNQQPSVPCSDLYSPMDVEQCSQFVGLWDKRRRVIERSDEAHFEAEVSEPPGEEVRLREAVASALLKQAVGVVCSVDTVPQVTNLNEGSHGSLQVGHRVILPLLTHSSGRAQPSAPYSVAVVIEPQAVLGSELHPPGRPLHESVEGVLLHRAGSRRGPSY